jgi:hypothetical protein
LQHCRIAINISKITAALFVKAAKCIQKPRTVELFGEPVTWLDTAQYLGVTHDIQLTWSTDINLVGRQPKDWAA